MRIWCEVRYICARGGSGSTRMYLDEVGKWLEEDSTRLVHGISHIKTVA